MIKKWLCGVILGCLVLFGMSAHAQMECGERMQIEINNKIYSVVLENNMTADALRRRLPMTLNMEDLNVDIRKNLFKIEKDFKEV